METKSRIRYQKKDGKLVSIEPITSKRTGAKYQVFIDPETMTYVIRNLLTMKKYEGGEGINNMNVLKNKVKKHLQALGCEFDKERRNRLFGRCEKGYSNAIHVAKLKEAKSSEL